MKKSIILIAFATLIFSSCILQKQSVPGHTYDNLRMYTYSKFHNHVVYTAGVVHMLVSLDEYMAASEEEKWSEAFKWHRENIFHEDDVTFMIEDLGTIHTYGKRLGDPDSNWKINGKSALERLGEQSWRVSLKSITDADLSSIVTYTGKTAYGEHVFEVEVNTYEERYTSRFNDTSIKAILTTSEGPVTVVDPMPTDYYYGYDNQIPAGKGVFRIDTQRNGQPLDWAELRYKDNDSTLTFSTNLR